MNHRYHRLCVLCLALGLLILIGCNRPAGTLESLDSGMRQLSTTISPALVILHTVGDSSMPSVVAGTAISIGSNGELLTTASAFKDGKPLVAKLPNGKVVPVQLIGADWETNLAVMKLEANENLPVVALIGPTDISTGQLAFLVGTAPLVNGSFVTYGTMAHSLLGGDDPYNYSLYAMMTMSLIARPGAPLFDTGGLLIGMLDGRMKDQNGGYWTVIPLNTIKKILPLLESGSGIPRGYLGILPGVPDENVEQMGVVVDKVLTGSVAEKIGIKAGDVITEVNEIRTLKLSTLRMNIASMPDKTVTIEISRNGVPQKLSLTLASHVPTANDAIRDPLRKL